MPSCLLSPRPRCSVHTPSHFPASHPRPRPGVPWSEGAELRGSAEGGLGDGARFGEEEARIAGAAAPGGARLPGLGGSGGGWYSLCSLLFSPSLHRLLALLLNVFIITAATAHLVWSRLDSHRYEIFS